MGYIENREHFINYLNKAIRDSQSVDHSELLPAEFYVSRIWEKGKGEALTWEVRQEGPKVLEEDNIFKWLKEKVHDKPLRARFSQEMAPRFEDLIDELEGISGVYCFINEDGTALYVGRSVNLSNRLWTSAQRFSNQYDRDIYVKLITDFNPAESAVIEVYFINKYKPPYNGADVFSDPLDIDLTCDPSWSDPIRAIIATE